MKTIKELFLEFTPCTDECELFNFRVKIREEAIINVKDFRVSQQFLESNKDQVPIKMFKYEFERLQGKIEYAIEKHELTEDDLK